MALCSTSRSSEQRLEAMKWYFGKRHCRTIDFTIDAQGESFALNVIDYNYAEKKYLVFLDDGVASAPTPGAGVSLITVDTSAAVNDEDMADAFVVSMASIEVRIHQTDASVEVQNYFVGSITAESYANAPGLTMEVGAIGFGGYIGQTGESELTTTVEVVQLLDDAQGTVIQDEVITGYSAEITIPLREMSTQRWKDLVGSVTGNNVTIDSKDIVGLGTEKLYQSMFQYSGRLVGHPVRNESINIDEDIVMLNTAPKMNSINFSGASIQEAEFLFTSYKDANADEKLNLLARGDHSKF